MKKILLSLAISLFFFSVSSAAGKTFDDLTNYQKQKYWDAMKNECQPLLLANKQKEYLTCALNAIDKAYNSAKEPWCKDSDNGQDFLTKGSVTTDTDSVGKQDYSYAYSGKTYAMEGYCGTDKKYASFRKDCLDFGSKYVTQDGVCVNTNVPPVLNSILDQQVNEGGTLAFSLSGSDKNNDKLTYFAQNIPVSARFSSSTGYFFFQPDFNFVTHPDVQKSFIAQFRAFDGESYSQWMSVKFTVKDVNQAPALTPIGNKSFLTSDSLSFTVSGKDTDGDTMQFSAKDLPVGSTFQNNTFSWSPEYEQAGEYQITFSVSDGSVFNSETIKIKLIKVGTELCGIISTNTVLKRHSSPYIVNCNVLIPQNVSVQIEPGTTIKFNGAWYIKVQGELISEGTGDKIITFTSNRKNPKSGDWGNIRFINAKGWDGSNGSRIRYTNFSYGGHPQILSSGDTQVEGVIYIENTNLSVENVVAEEIYYFFIRAEGGSSIFNNNVIKNIAGPNASAFYLNQQGNFTLKGNTISNVETEGITCWLGSTITVENNIIKQTGNGGGIRIGNCNAEIKNNTISNNGIGIYIYPGLLPYGKQGNINISNNSLADNNVGIHLDKEQATSSFYTITNNTISGGETGMLITKDANVANTSSGSIEYNTFTDNKYGFKMTNTAGGENVHKNNILNSSQYAAFIDKAYPGSAVEYHFENNYWGITDTSLIDKKIHDYFDDFDLGKVLYDFIAPQKF